MSVSSATTLISPSNGGPPPSTSAAAGAGGASASTASSGSHAHPPTRRRQSTHSAGHGHSVHSAHGHGHGHGHGHSAHSSRRTTHTAHSSAHGHGHSHSHSSHSASHRGTRRSSEGENGRRALAAGLTMAALDAVQAATSGGAAGASAASGGANAGASVSTTGGVTTGTTGSGSDKDPRERERKPKRRANEHHAHHAHGTRAHHGHTHAHIPKTSRSETHLPRLSRTPSSGGVSALTSESSQMGHSRRPGGNRSRTRSEEATVEVEVVSGDGAEDAGDAAAGDEGEWESGEETPGVGSRRRRSVAAEVAHHQRTASERKVSNAESHASAMSAAAEDDPLELGSQHSPGHEPPVTRKTTGFGATSHTSIPSEAAAAEAETSASSGISAAAAAAAAVVADGAIAATPLSSAELPSDNSGDTAPTSSSTAAHLTSEMTEPTAPGTGFPFPRMPSDGAAGTEADLHRHRDRSISYASAISESPVQVSQLGASHATTQSTRSRVTSSAASRSLATSGGAHTATTLRRPGSQQSLRSIQSLRAAPHPLNSPTGRSGFLHVNSPKEKRVSSLHYPPAAPAVVYKETVGGHGWDEEGAEAAQPRRPQEVPAAAAPQPRTERVGSFSSVRSLKDLLASSVGGTNPVPSTRAVTRGAGGAGTPGRDPSRRMTAMQAASAVARLNTTSDPVAYHQSLGFSPQTAETAHLLSRFLPTHRAHRPKWAISAHEAMAVMEAAAAGEEPECRVGLTDGQYRDAHESLVTTLREFGKPPAGTVGRRGGAGHGGSGGSGSIGAAARNYSYHNLLGAAEQVGPHSRGTGQTPFELSVARSVAQRPKQLAMF